MSFCAASFPAGGLADFLTIESHGTFIKFVFGLFAGNFALDGIHIGQFVLWVLFFFGLGQFAHTFAKFFDTLADGGTHFWQLFGAKDEEGYNKNNDQFRCVKSKHGMCPFLTWVYFLHENYGRLRYYGHSTQ